MAGSWPDCPSRKIAYHDDGTVVAGRYTDSGAPYENFYEWAPADVIELNDLDFVAFGATGDWPDNTIPMGRYGPGPSVLSNTQVVWIFPERRDIYGFVAHLHHTGGSTDPNAMDVHSSTDTTNGIDGTWTKHLTYWSNSNVLIDAQPESWRTRVITIDAPGTRAVRTSGYTGSYGKEFNWRCFYIFGMIAAGETPDRILFVDDNTGLEFTKPMDWGDVPRGTTLDWDIYLLNNSSTLAAGGTMVLDFTTLYNTSDTWYQIKSTAGGAFADTFDVPTMAAGTRYPTGTDTFTVRLTVPDDEPLSIYEAILELSPATSWT